MAKNHLVEEPIQRKLRIFALDPSVAAQHGTSSIAEITISIPWSKQLRPGPVDEYIEVVDADPASGCFYEPVDLNDRRILAQNGLAPSETNPQFHQQMVYAVARATIEHFEQALGRVALWSSHRDYRNKNTYYYEQFVPRLRIYPHALRDRNAYYSPQKKALLLGYFPAGVTDANNTRESLIFTALSHDIIAHETTHALLDGVHPRFNEPVNGDVLAFHEGFADIVALFQHFSYPGVLRDQIARTRGNLSEQNLLGQLAQQFGRAAGRGGALRDYLGEVGEDGKWRPVTPSVTLIDRTTEPHERGAILVAAVFGAFLTVYKARTSDLYRIASEGTGVLREGDIHPDLSNRLADEAASCARYVLQMCIRAIDYCPPVDITFGDYLRAVVTADYDFNREDPYGYRLAIVESFRQWGIHPRGMRSMSVEALLWPTGEAAMEEEGMAQRSRDLSSLLEETQDSASLKEVKRRQHDGHRGPSFKPWSLESDRQQAWQDAGTNGATLWQWLHGAGSKLLPVFGLDVCKSAPPTVFRSRATKAPTLQVQVRTALRRSTRGSTVTDLVVEITQRRRGYFDVAKQKRKDASKKRLSDRDRGDFYYRAGCTLLVDPATMRVRRVIRTPGTITDDVQLERVRSFLNDGGLQPSNAFWMARSALTDKEPFALLHRHAEE